MVQCKVKTSRFHHRGPGVQSLVRELRSHKPHSVAKKKKKRLKTANSIKFKINIKNEFCILNWLTNHTIKE